MPESLNGNPIFQELIRKYIYYFSLVWARESAQHGIAHDQSLQVYEQVVNIIQNLISDYRIYDFRCINKGLASLICQELDYLGTGTAIGEEYQYIYPCLEETYKHPLFRDCARNLHDTWLASIK